MRIKKFKVLIGIFAGLIYISSVEADPAPSKPKEKLFKTRPSMAKPDTDGYISGKEVVQQRLSLKEKPFGDKPAGDLDGYVSIDDGYAPLKEDKKLLRKTKKDSLRNIIVNTSDGYIAPPAPRKNRKIKGKAVMPDGYTVYIGTETSDGYTVYTSTVPSDGYKALTTPLKQESRIKG